MPQPQKILVVQPNWVGDAVMATPTLRALRELYPDAHISYLVRRYVKPIFTGLPWCDRLISYRTGRTKAKAGKGLMDLAARLRAGRFDVAILLPNSLKSALVCKLARIKRVVGYERDGRGFLLTDKLLPAKERGKFVPTPIVNYYLGIAKYLGSKDRDTRLELFITPSERAEAQRLLNRIGLDPSINRPAASGQPPLVLLNPGAQYGDAKCWLPSHFAAVADRFIEELGATILLSGGPRERRILDAVQRHMKHLAIDLPARGLTLGALKEIVNRCDLMITNDTGPRHIAAAFDVPVVTVFWPDLSRMDRDQLRQGAKGIGEGLLRPLSEKEMPPGPPLHDPREPNHGLRRRGRPPSSSQLTTDRACGVYAPATADWHRSSASAHRSFGSLLTCALAAATTAGVTCRMWRGGHWTGVGPVRTASRTQSGSRRNSVSTISSCSVSEVDAASSRLIFGTACFTVVALTGMARTQPMRTILLSLLKPSRRAGNASGIVESTSAARHSYHRSVVARIDTWPNSRSRIRPGTAVFADAPMATSAAAASTRVASSAMAALSPFSTASVLAIVPSFWSVRAAATRTVRLRWSSASTSAGTPSLPAARSKRTPTADWPLAAATCAITSGISRGSNPIAWTARSGAAVRVSLNARGIR